jgi:plasmid stabilization system protein ParE
MKIKWTPKARNTYFSILDYLDKEWSEKEVIKFIIQVNSILMQISETPKMFKASKSKLNIRRAIITKHNSLYYRVKKREDEIELLAFWDNRQDPTKSQY